MTDYLLLLAETVAFIASIGITQLVILAFRNPLRTGILRSEPMAIFSVMMLVLVLGLGVAAQAHGLYNVGLGPVACIIGVIAVFGATLWANAQAFDIRERLRRADAGESPFYRSRSDLPRATPPTAGA